MFLGRGTNLIFSGLIAFVYVCLFLSSFVFNFFISDSSVMFGFLAVLTLGYFVFLATRDIEYNRWMRASLWVNIVNFLFIVFIFGISVLDFLACVGGKCFLSIAIGFIFASFGSVILLIVSFVLFFVGSLVMRREKSMKKSSKRSRKKK